MNIRENIANELHAPARRSYPTRAVEIKGINDLLQADLIDLILYSKENKGYKHILTVINCFSKYAYAIPVKNKSSLEIVKAITPILEKNKIRHLQTDAGKEFYNSHFKKLMKKYNIHHYSTFSNKKASIVERFNRTLKEMMWKKFTEIGKYHWLEMLPSLLRIYNTKTHRTIGMAPSHVKKHNEKQVLLNINKNRQKYKSTDKKINFKVGDMVRISKYKQIFDKGYLPNWSNEIFLIDRVSPTTIPTTYHLKDLSGNEIKGSFYGKELQKSKTGNVYLIEKVLRKKGNKLYVKWKGFNGSHNSWIDKKDVV